MLEDIVTEFDSLIEWERFRPLIGDLNINTTDQGGRLNFVEILMQSRITTFLVARKLFLPSILLLAKSRCDKALSVFFVILFYYLETRNGIHFGYEIDLFGSVGNYALFLI